MMRCCKDLGVASELWDPRFVRKFKAEYTREVFVEHVASKKKTKIWLRKASFDMSFSLASLLTYFFSAGRSYSVSLCGAKEITILVFLCTNGHDFWYVSPTDRPRLAYLGAVEDPDPE